MRFTAGVLLGLAVGYLVAIWISPVPMVEAPWVDTHKHSHKPAKPCVKSTEKRIC